MALSYSFILPTALHGRIDYYDHHLPARTRSGESNILTFPFLSVWLTQPYYYHYLLLLINNETGRNSEVSLSYIYRCEAFIMWEELAAVASDDDRNIKTYHLAWPGWMTDLRLPQLCSEMAVAGDGLRLGWSAVSGA